LGDTVSHQTELRVFHKSKNMMVDKNHFLIMMGMMDSTMVWQCVVACILINCVMYVLTLSVRKVAVGRRFFDQARNQRLRDDDEELLQSVKIMVGKGCCDVLSRVEELLVLVPCKKADVEGTRTMPRRRGVELQKEEPSMKGRQKVGVDSSDNDVTQDSRKAKQICIGPEYYDKAYNIKEPGAPEEGAESRLRTAEIENQEARTQERDRTDESKNG
jgi:hypothetical protein